MLPLLLSPLPLLAMLLPLLTLLALLALLLAVKAGAFPTPAPAPGAAADTTEPSIEWAAGGAWRGCIACWAWADGAWVPPGLGDCSRDRSRLTWGPGAPSEP